jgi:transcriptional regulator PpsR
LNQRAPEGADSGSLSSLAPELAETVVSVASDLALVIDLDGTIRSVAVARDAADGLSPDWIGREWADTVSPESRAKVAQLLRDASLAGVARRRQVNHPCADGPDVPVSYAAVRLGESGPLLAVGRDMRPLAQAQQRFVQQQIQMERDSQHRRRADARYRRLFEAVPDAVLVLDAATLAVVEANAACASMLGRALDGLVGCPMPELIDSARRAPVTELLAAARIASDPIEIRTRFSDDGPQLDVSVTPVTAGDAPQMLVRIRLADPMPPSLEAALRPLRPRLAPDPARG